MVRSFKGIWIPKELWLDENLTMIDKAVYAEVGSLSGSDQGCYASNEYLAKFCGCSISKITKSIAKLSNLGYLTSEGYGKQRKLKTISYFLRDNLVKSTRKSSKKYEEINIGNNIESNIYNKMSQISKIEEKDEEKNQKFDPKSDPYLLSRFLEKNICINNPKFPTNENQRQRWAKDIDKMIRIDKIKPDDIANVIRFCQQDSFWRCNVLSGKKLRERYQQLTMKMLSQR